MMKRLFSFCMLFFCYSLIASGFKLSSTDFKNNKAIPKKCVMTKVGGQNLSPELIWEKAPKGTKSFVVSCIDKNKVAKRWVHWMVVNIPSDTKKLSRSASASKMPTECKELKNSFGDFGYGGSQPPSGTGVHKYVFTIYALNVDKLELEKQFLSEKELLKLLKGKIIKKASIIGTYKIK
jgi:Raf kinase inhibitor-like YbhB/YbcL family protein